MRIIAGLHKSRILMTLDGLNTRPMMDKMKESIFNTIGPYFDGGVVLDLFGGSGALSLEAISRGMSSAVIVDMNREAIQVINQNVTLLKEESKITIMNCDYNVALKRLENQRFDLLFLDPPFKMNIINEIIDTLLEKNMINEEGIIVCQAVKGNMVISDKLHIIKHSFFGNNEVVIYQK